MKLFQVKMVSLMTKGRKFKKIHNSSLKYLMREKVARLAHKIRMFNVIFVELQVTNNHFIQHAKI
jgi:hypothetical protein